MATTTRLVLGAAVVGAALVLAAAAAAGIEGKILWSAGNDIYVSDPDGGGLTRLTCYSVPPAFSASAGDATWSPDGSKIAFQKYDYVGWSVYVMNGDGSGQHFVGPGLEPAFSPDGTKVAFAGPDIRSLWVANVDGTNLHQLNYYGYVDDPSWSPDGTEIALSDIYNGIWILRADNSGAVALLPKPASGGFELRTAWSPNGSKIAFVYSSGNQQDDREIWTVNAAGGSYTRITNNSVYDDYPGWTPAGRLFWTQNNYIPFVADADGGNVQQLSWVGAATIGGLSMFDWSGSRALDATENQCSTTPNGTLDQTPVDTSSGPVTLTTDTSGAGATSDVPVQTSITIPQGESGTVSVAQRPIVTITPLTSYNFLGRELQIEAPLATADNPLVLTFTIDSTLLAQQGADYTTVQIVRTSIDGTSVVLPDCDASTTAASPDPCVAARAQSGDDAVVTVRTSHASIWDFAIHKPYQFSGFSQPVDNTDSTGAFILNSMKAGSAVPVKFSLNGNQGSAIFASGSPASASFNCDPTLAVDAIEQTVNANSSSLSFNNAVGQYTYVWKTDSGWAGTCRQLVMKLADGTVHRADFKFTR
jgi:hypothetical protein